MKLLTGGSSLDEKLVNLVKSYDNIAFAVAWAGKGTQTYKALLDHRAKIRYGIIGTHFYQTHANVLDEFIGSKQVRFVLHSHGVFHPKAFLFWSEDRWELCVGSANLTKGAMGLNQELVLHVTSDSGSQSVRRDLLRQIEEYWKIAEIITKQDATAYRALWSVQQRKRETTATKHWTRSKSIPSIRVEIMFMSWEDFVRDVIAEDTEFFTKRCTQIKDAREAFRSQKSYAKMDLDTRKMIAGLPNPTYPYWACFGSMKGAGHFKHAIIDKVDGLSHGLDAIPLDGPVTESMYLTYIEAFRKAIPEVKDGIGTATRLLAMKRPDFFVCLDNANKSKLCKAFGIAAHGMDYQRYWDEILTRIYDSVWWNAPYPEDDSEKLIWRARTAMLDALYYDPK